MEHKKADASKYYVGESFVIPMGSGTVLVDSGTYIFEEVQTVNKDGTITIDIRNERKL